jgi:hypothetical protein
LGHGRNRDAQLRPHTPFVSQRPDPPTPASAPFHKACLDRQWAGVSIPGYQHVQRAGRAEKGAYPTTVRVDKVKGSRRCQCRNPTDAHARFAVKAASAGRIQIVRLLFKPTGLRELVAPYRSAMGTPPPVDKQVAVGFNPRPDTTGRQVLLPNAERRQDRSHVFGKRGHRVYGTSEC